MPVGLMLDLLPMLGAIPLAVRRAGADPDLLVADPPLTRAQAIEWLFEGRLTPGNFVPVPPADASGRYTHFNAHLTPDEFVAAREAFIQQWLSLARRPPVFPESIPSWVPASVRQELITLIDGGRMRRSQMPWVKRYPNYEPHRDLVVWIGMPTYTNITMEFLGYFPDDPAWYENLLGAGTQRAHLVHFAYSSWNADMRYFIEEQRMEPERARDEVRYLWQKIFLSMVGAVSDIMGNLSGANIASHVSGNATRTMTEVLEQFQAQRRLFSLAKRRARPLLVLFRGTIQRLKYGDPTYALEHDLGRGTYFTTSEELAAIYAAERGTAIDPKILLRAEVELSELGNVLDLVNGPFAARWKKEVEAYRSASGAHFINETYRKYLEGFLEDLGHKLDDFDTIIASEYRNNNVQVCIKDRSIVDRIFAAASELYQ